MPEINFFKIYPRQKMNLINLLEEKGIISTESKNLECEQGEMELSLLFSQSPQETDVKWIKEINKLFSINEKKRHNYSAAILIDFNENTYCISYGSSHFYISRYCEYEFGIDFASRVLKTFKIKNSRSFGGSTNKSILTYNNINELIYDGGESVSYLKGEPKNKEYWGKNISCGQSIKVRKRDFNIRKINEIIPKIEDVILNGQIIVDIPRSILINDTDRKNALIDKLINDIENQNYIVSISEQQLSGVEFIFSDKYDYFLIIQANEIELSNGITLENLNELVSNHNISISHLLKLEVKAKENDEYKFGKPFIEFIDYIDSNDNYYLESGKWYQFDANYLNFLRKAVDLINTNFENEISVFDEQEYQNWLEQNSYSSTVWYREKYLNNLLEDQYGYTNYDRDFTQYEKYTIEFTDLYKNNEFIAVKIGKPQKLGYVIDQSLNALKVIQHSDYEIKIGEENTKVKKFVLWLFFERTNNIQKLSDINSIVFLMKLANWRKEVLLAGFEAEIKISYRRV